MSAAIHRARVALLLTMACVACVHAQTLQRRVIVKELASDIPVSPRAVNLSSTPIALCGERMVVVTVEEAETPNASRLPTVAHLGQPDADGNWQWRRTVIEPRTSPDTYHTQPSVGVDKRGYVHIAYNMHNMPWQYMVSREPCSISDFEFRGEVLTDEDLHTVFEENRTPFPSVGRAAIPGNQITYPVFTVDRRGDLYVSFRFAVRPARPWLERGFGAGIARYDVDSRTWHSIAGAVPLAREDAITEAGRTQSLPFAWQPGWTAYYPRLWFDAANGMHVVWTWREKEAGIDTKRPSYAYRAGAGEFRRADGSIYQLPILHQDAGAIDIPNQDTFFSGVAITTNCRGEPLAVVQPVDSTRLLAWFDKQDRRWRTAASPHGASSVLCENNGDCWAYASGPRILRRQCGETSWRMTYEGQGYCDPKPLHDAGTGRRFLYVTRCDQRSARVLEIIG